MITADEFEERYRPEDEFLTKLEEEEEAEGLTIQDLPTTDQFYYSLRLTPYPNTDLKTQFCQDRIESFLMSLSIKSYLYGREYEKNHHFHIVFSSPIELKKYDITVLRDSLYSHFDVPEEKKGNATYSLESVRNLEQALAYAVKDGCYGSSGNWDSIANQAFEASFTKVHSVKSSLSDLSNKFINNQITEKELWISLGKTRAELGIPLSLRWMDEMLFSIQVKKDPSILEEKWEDKIIKEHLKQLK